MAEVLNIAAVHREGLPALQIGLRTDAFDIIRDSTSKRIRFIDAISKEAIPLDGYVTETVLSNTLSSYATIESVNQAFSKVYTTSQVDTLLSDMSTSITNQFSGVYNKQQVDSKIPTITAQTRAPTTSDTGKPGDLWIVYE